MSSKIHQSCLSVARLPVKVEANFAPSAPSAPSSRELAHGTSHASVQGSRSDSRSPCTHEKPDIQVEGEREDSARLYTLRTDEAVPHTSRSPVAASSGLLLSDREAVSGSQSIALVNFANTHSTPRAKGPKDPAKANRERLKRRELWQLRQSVQDVTQLPRVKGCGCTSFGPVEVRVKADRATYYGMKTCGSVWACPVCSQKIRRKRADEMFRALSGHVASGGGLATAMYSLPHIRKDKLEALWVAMVAAWKHVLSGRRWMEDRDTYGILGTHRTQEVTFSPASHGWHPHLHVIFFTRAPLSEDALATLSERLFTRWNAKVRALLDGRECVNSTQTPDGKPLFSLRAVQSEGAISAYIQKVTLEKTALEQTRTDAKRKPDGQTEYGLHPFQLALRADPEDAQDTYTRAWREYESVTHGQRSSAYSHGLRALLGLGEDEPEDETLASDEPEDEPSELICTLTSREFRRLWRSRQALHLLEAIEATDTAYVQFILSNYAREPEPTPYWDK